MMRGAKLFLGLAITAVASCTTPQSMPASTPAFVGSWHQVDAECAGAEPVRELIFSADGNYSVTWTPFETYKDYWGGWRYDARSRVLTLTVEGGNYTPSDMTLSGAVSADAHTLTLGAISLGSKGGARCTAVFRR